MSRTSDLAYRRRRAALLRPGAVCYLCGNEIDVSLKWPDPLSGTADHVVPFSQGGSNLSHNLRPAHLDCNRKRQTRPIEEVAPLKRSRDW